MRLIKPSCLISFLAFATLLTGCTKKDSEIDPIAFLFVSNSNESAAYVWDLPEGFPQPSVPADNAMSQEKVDLGRRLFYDKRLSRDESMSCASCHLQERAFTDGRRLPSGIASVGHTHIRNAQHLGNVGFVPRLNWAGPNTETLEDQAKGPLFQEGAPVVELGLTDETYRSQALEKLKEDSVYPGMFRRAFGSESIDFDKIRMAISAFERTIVSGNSPYDQYVYQGDHTALNAKAYEGMLLFDGERAECFHCHGGFNFTDTSLHDQTVFLEVFFHDNGNKSKADYLAIPSTDEIPSSSHYGLAATSGKDGDVGKFRAPSLRNVAMTYPYFHDGSVACDDFVDGEDWREECAREALLKIVNHYSAGGYKSNSGNDFGLEDDAATNRDESLIRPFSITSAEKEALVEFLMALTDQDFLNHTNFSNPEPENPLFGP